MSKCYFDGCENFITHRFPETDVVGMCTEHARTIDNCENLVPEEGICHFCGDHAHPDYTIHRDGFLVGPEVGLCELHASDVNPTCEAIWLRIHLCSATSAEAVERG